MFFAFMVEGTVADWNGLFMRDTLGAPEALAALGYPIFEAGMLIARLTGDRLRSRFGVRGMLTVSGLATAGFFAVVLAAPAPMVALVAVFFVGLGVATISPLTLSLAGTATDTPGPAIAQAGAMGYAGLLLGPVVIGFLSDATSLRTALGLAVVLGLLIAAAARFLPREEPVATPPAPVREPVTVAEANLSRSAEANLSRSGEASLPQSAEPCEFPVNRASGPAGRSTPHRTLTDSPRTPPTRQATLGLMIQLNDLTKRYGEVIAVDGLDFTVRPGVVTGFLGPNGAGKTTTMRMILGLDLPTSGSVTIGGRLYRDLPTPLREVGSLLDAQALHPRRSASDHLRYLAQSNGIPTGRVAEVLDLVGLSNAAGRSAGEFSLGMSQRLGIAAALLGDPPVLLLDEPVNGLDPEGVLWIRNLMRSWPPKGARCWCPAT